MECYRKDEDYAKKVAVRSQALELESDKTRNITVHEYFKY